jgi:hypothetical protein
LFSTVRERELSAKLISETHQQNLWSGPAATPTASFDNPIILAAVRAGRIRARAALREWAPGKAVHGGDSAAAFTRGSIPSLRQQTDCRTAIMRGWPHASFGARALPDVSVQDAAHLRVPGHAAVSWAIDVPMPPVPPACAGRDTVRDRARPSAWAARSGASVATPFAALTLVPRSPD